MITWSLNFGRAKQWNPFGDSGVFQYCIGSWNEREITVSTTKNPPLPGAHSHLDRW